MRAVCVVTAPPSPGNEPTRAAAEVVRLSHAQLLAGPQRHRLLQSVAGVHLPLHDRSQLPAGVCQLRKHGLKIPVDLGVGNAVEEWLATRGHDVLPVRDIDPRLPDDKILSRASTE